MKIAIKPLKSWVTTILVLLSFMLISARALAVESAEEVCLNATHTDIILSIDPPTKSGGRIIVTAFGDFDDAQASNVYIEAISRKRLVKTHFCSLLQPNKTNNPGWRMANGTLLADELLWFRALGKLQYWNPELNTWGAPPNGEVLHYYNSIPPSSTLPDDEDFDIQGTRWSATGVAGPSEAPIEEASSSGGIHAHFDFCLRDQDGDCLAHGGTNQGNPARGAYTIELQLFSTAKTVDNLEKYIPSRPIKILFNKKLNSDELANAVGSLTTPERISDQTLPPAGILIFTGK